MDPEIYCKSCYVYQPYKGNTHCQNLNCGVRLSAWHIAKQLKNIQNGAVTPDVYPPQHG